MKRLSRLTAASTVALAMTLSLACTASAVKTEYTVLGVTVHTVDLAMNAWGEYVRAGQAKPGQEDTVRSAFATYQNAAKVALVALDASSSMATPPELAAGAAALVSIIETFTGKKIPPQPPTPTGKVG